MSTLTEQAPLPPFSSVAVLVVDDSEVLRTSLSDLLREGYTVCAAPDGRTALDRLRSHPAPMIVVLEWYMPNMNGVQVLQALAADAAEQQSHSFIVLIAADDALRQRLSRDIAGLPSHLSVMVLSKPYDVGFLLTLVAHAAAQLAHDP